MKFLPFLLLSVSAFAQMGDMTPVFTKFKCTYQGQTQGFELQIQETMNPYKNVIIGKKMYVLGGGGGCMALDCDNTSLTLSNDSGSVEVTRDAKGVQGVVAGKGFHCKKTK